MLNRRTAFVWIYEFSDWTTFEILEIIQNSDRKKFELKGVKIENKIGYITDSSYSKTLLFEKYSSMILPENTWPDLFFKDLVVSDLGITSYGAPWCRVDRLIVEVNIIWLPDVELYR